VPHSKLAGLSDVFPQVIDNIIGKKMCTLVFWKRRVDSSSEWNQQNMAHQSGKYSCWAKSRVPPYWQYDAHFWTTHHNMSVDIKLSTGGIETIAFEHGVEKATQLIPLDDLSGDCRFLVMGGRREFAKISIHDSLVVLANATEGTSEVLPKNKCVRDKFAACIIHQNNVGDGRRIIVLGGQDKNTWRTKNVKGLDLERNTWITLHPLHHQRCTFNAVSWDRHVVAGPGTTWETVVLLVEQMDLHLAEWIDLPQIPVDGNLVKYVEVQYGKVGTTPRSNFYAASLFAKVTPYYGRDSLLMFDPPSNEWIVQDLQWVE